MATLLKQKFLDVEERLEYIRIPGDSGGFKQDSASTLSWWVIAIHHEFFGSRQQGKGVEAKWRARNGSLYLYVWAGWTLTALDGLRKE